MRVLFFTLALLLVTGLPGVSFGGVVPCNNDGVTQAPEECDDGNTVPGDGCDLCVACGNGQVTGNEECDDGNTVDDDDCNGLCLSNCGNGVVDPNSSEICDDGNTIDDDACPNRCAPYVCGDGVIDPGEACDDGNTVDADECTNECLINGFVDIPRGSVKCVDRTNKAYAKLRKAQGKDQAGCIKDFAKGKSQDAQTCLTADAKGKVAKAEGNVTATRGKLCGDPNQPGFAYNVDGAAASTAVAASSLALFSDLFGDDANAALVAKATDKDGAKCQDKAHKAAQKTSEVFWKLAIKAKNRAFKGRQIPQAMTAADVEVAIAVLASDPKLGKAVAKVEAAVAKCPPNVAALFPGAGGTDAAARQAICRAVEALNVADNLALDADAISGGTCL